MQAADIMTTNVISVRPETEVREIAGLLLQHRISAVPVVDEDMRILGLVSEGDLIRRVETGTDAPHSWWLADVFSTHDKTVDYIKSHGRHAADVMTENVITVSSEASLADIAGILEKHHIKRVPVAENGRLIGIVSRANLLHGLIAHDKASEATPPPSNQELRERLLNELSQAAGADAPLINATVVDGAVQLWGNVDSTIKKKAAEVAAENITGVRSVENNIRVVPSWKAVY